ncbi:Serine/threonine-protein kinase STY46 [Linum perenne]
MEIKVVHRGDNPEEVSKRESRFAREIVMLSRVQHKNLVKFIGACNEPIMVIVTKLLAGGTLLKYLLNMRPRCLATHVAIGLHWILLVESNAYTPTGSFIMI